MSSVHILLNRLQFRYANGNMKVQHLVSAVAQVSESFLCTIQVNTGLTESRNQQQQNTTVLIYVVKY